MNKKSAITHLVVCFAIIIITFLVTGFLFTSPYAKKKMLRELYSPFHNNALFLGRYNNHMDMARAFGTTDSYREAIFQYIKAMDEATAFESEDVTISEILINVDKAVCYARLSLIEEQEQNHNKSEEYKKEALSFFKITSWPEPTYEKLLEIIAKLDENFVFKSKK